MNRIETIDSLINEKDKVVDVGCDQVELSILLSKRNIKSIACDISKNVVEKASNKINKLNLNNYIDLRLSNGLSNIKEDEVDTLVLAGMGTHTILEIIKNTDIRFKKIITISNNYHDILRKEMNNFNYKVSYEIIIKENNKYYNLIVFNEGKYNYSEKELLLGLNHKENKVYMEYLNYLKCKYDKINIESNGKNEKINKILKYMEEE